MVLALWIQFASSCIYILHVSCARVLKHYQIMADWKKWYILHCFIAAAEGNLEKKIFFALCMILADGNGHWNWQMNKFCLRYLMTPRVFAKCRPPKTELTGKARHIASCIFCFRCCSYCHVCSLWPHISSADAHWRILQPRSIFPIALGLLGHTPVEPWIIRSLFCCNNQSECRSKWPRGPGRCSTAAHLLGLQVWIPLGAWIRRGDPKVTGI
jgi:hypothetical protein